MGNKYFYIDFDKLDALLNEKGMTRADLAKFFDRDRGWLTQVKNREGKTDAHIAEAIRRYLGCGSVQEFGQEKSDYYSPVKFHEEKYMEEAEQLFRELNEKRGEDLYTIFDFLKRDEHGFECLLASIRMRDTRVGSNQFVGSEWIRVLYISELAREMSKRLKEELKLRDHGSCEEQEIRDRFYRLKESSENDGSGELFKYYLILKNIVHNRLSEPTKRLLEHLLKTPANSKEESKESKESEESKFDKMTEEVEMRCAEFIFSVFYGPSGDISMKEQKELYEQGFLF